MDIGSPRRVEIELEEQTVRPSRFRRRAEPAAPTPPPSFGPPPTSVPHDAVFTPPTEPAGTPDGGERRRLVATGLAVGAVALFLGWALGRSGGDGAAETGGTPAPTTAVGTTTATTSTPATVAADDTLPEAELPATTRPRPSTTTTLPPEWETGTLALDPRLAGQADRIVATADDGDLFELDLATGATRSLEAGRPSRTSTMTPVAGDDWIVLPFDDGTGSLLFVGDDPTPGRLSDQDMWSTYWSPATGSYWKMEWDPMNGRTVGVGQYTFDGEPTGETLDTKGLWASAADPLGGVVLNGGSIGNFSVSPSGATRLPNGQILGLTATHLAVLACGDDLGSCGIAVLDRASGESRAVPADADVVSSLLTNGGYWGGNPSTPLLNVDATAIFTTTIDEQGTPVVGVLDLVSGEMASPWDDADAFGAYGYPSAAWSADGRFAYLAIDGELQAFDRKSGELFPVVTGDLDLIRTLTVRPVPA